MGGDGGHGENEWCEHARVKSGENDVDSHAYKSHLPE